MRKKPARGQKRIQTKYATTCSRCGRALPEGWWVLWSPGSQGVECAGECVTVKAKSGAFGSRPVTPVAGMIAGTVVGEAGASAKAEALRQKAEGAADAANWSKGAFGEYVIGKDLAAYAARTGAIVLHDRAIPGSEANLDHLVVTPDAVYVIDSKNYSGEIRVRTTMKRKRGTEHVLEVNGVNRTKVLDTLTWEAGKVRDRLREAGYDVPVIPVMTFLDGEFGGHRLPIDLVPLRITREPLDALATGWDRDDAKVEELAGVLSCVFPEKPTATPPTKPKSSPSAAPVVIPDKPAAPVRPKTSRTPRPAVVAKEPAKPGAAKSSSAVEPAATAYPGLLVPEDRTGNYANAAVIFGVISFLTGWFAPLGMFFGALALWQAKAASKARKAAGRPMPAKAVIGAVLGGLGLGFGLMMFLLLAAYAASSG